MESSPIKKPVVINGRLALMGIDTDLKQRCAGEENAFEVTASMTMVPEMAKRIEHVGQAYEKIKVRVHK